MSELVHLYDVEVEDSETDSRTVNGQSSSDVDKKEGLAGGSREEMEMAVSSATKPTEGAITCNSTEMIREKRHCDTGRLVMINAIVLNMISIPGTNVAGLFPAFQCCTLYTENLARNGPRGCATYSVDVLP